MCDEDVTISFSEKNSIDARKCKNNILMDQPFADENILDVDFIDIR